MVSPRVRDVPGFVAHGHGDPARVTGPTKVRRRTVGARKWGHLVGHLSSPDALVSPSIYWYQVARTATAIYEYQVAELLVSIR